MWRVPFSIFSRDFDLRRSSSTWRTMWRRRVSFVLICVLLYLDIPHITLYFSLKNVAHTKGVSLSALWAREILFSRVPRVRDLLTSSPRRAHHERRKSRISRPVDRARAHVLPRFSPTIQVAAAQTSESCQSYESKKMRDLCPGTTYPDWPSVAWSIFIILGDLADINGVHPL